MRQFRARLFFVIAIMGTLCCIVVVRLFSIQILEGKRYAARSKDQTQHRRILTARRGSILDRNGRVLAVSMEKNVSIQADPVGISHKKSSGGKIGLKRVYPLGEVGGPLLGYIGKDGYGLGGVEFIFDHFLQGENGWTIVQKDGRNQRYQRIGSPQKAPNDGCTVYLTIDMEIQKIVQSVLHQTVTRLNAKGGMCVVMDPLSGDILAMASEPSFDPNFPGKYAISERQNRCVSAIYEPGSTFKLVTASAAIQDNIKNEQDIIHGNNGVFEIYNESIRDHQPHGYLTFVQALSVSSNVCFAKIANDIGNERLYRFTRDFGFGTRTGIDLPGEETGIVHPIRVWSGRTRVTMAIGQEISVTLLQMVMPFSAVANGGILLRPRIYNRVVNSEGIVVDSGQHRSVRRVLSEDTARRLRKMLTNVVSEGTGKNASIDGIAIAGKTGTSQKTDSAGTYSKHLSWSSFIGFLPSDNPVLLCGLVVDEPEKGEMGGVAAAPAFKKIMTQIMSNPELKYAEKILDRSIRSAPKNEPDKELTPIARNISDQNRSSADSTHPKPSQTKNGSIMASLQGKGPLEQDVQEKVLGFSELKGTADSATIPDCIGKDLREAVRVLCDRGIKPFAVGAGIVRHQTPSAGGLMKPALTCTLTCSMGG